MLTVLWQANTGLWIKSWRRKKKKNKLYVDLFKFDDSCEKWAAMEYYLAFLYPCEVCGTVWLHLLWSVSKIISAWRQQKWLKWFFILNTHKNTHVHTHTIKYRLIDISTQHQWIPQTLWKSSAKMWHIYTLPVFPHFNPPHPPKKPHHHHHPHPSPGPPSAGRMSLEVASDVSSSTGQRASAVGPWWMWLVWETIRCVWSTRHGLSPSCSNTSNDP